MKKYYIQFKADDKSTTVNIVASDFTKVLDFIKNHKFDNEIFKIKNIAYVYVDDDVFIAD